MREPAGGITTHVAGDQSQQYYQQQPQQQQQYPQQQQQRVGAVPPQHPVPNQLSVHQLQDMAMRQHHQIESQQQMLVAKEQRLKYLRQQDLRHNQTAAEYERLRRLREKVEAQEMKLRKLRALRGQPQGQQPPQGPPMATNASVSADLESIRGLFNEKEKELSMAVRKVEELTHQLEDLRSGRVNNHYPPQMVELERLRRELAYRKQLNEQQNNMITQQRAQLGMGHDEIAKIDNRIVELQDRLARKRMMNQQLASQISAATSAKQAQLRAIQQGMMNRNKNKPISTVEPFQRHQAAAAAAAHAAAVAHAHATGAEHQQQAYKDDLHNKINNKNKFEDAQQQQQLQNQNDPKYQTLPYSTKFAPTTNSVNVMKKIEALKQEKENNNLANDDLPPPPPQLPMGQQRRAMLDHQGNYSQGGGMDPPLISKPISSVAPVVSTSSLGASQKRPSDLFGSPDANGMTPQSQSTPIGGDLESPTTGKNKPTLPPKPNGSPRSSPQPPPYVPAPPPTTSTTVVDTSPQAVDTAITILRGGANSYTPPANLSVSTHPAEEGTSVDDDMPSVSDDNEDEMNVAGGSLMVRPNHHNVHISINRRIEMPPAFHFPEDQTPPSDLLGGDHSSSGGVVMPPRDVTDNAALYPMMNQIYKEFDHLSTEEKNQMFGGGARPDHMAAEEEEDAETTLNQVPDVIESETKGPMPPGIIKQSGGGSSSDNSGDEGGANGGGMTRERTRRISFDPLALLLDASLEGELELVQKTAREVPDPSAANDEGITALHNAICAGHLDIVRFLVEFGCDVNAQDSDGWTPLHCAASCNNLSMVRFLVEHGACIFATTQSDRETAAEKCEEDEEGFDGCSEYLYGVQEKLGSINSGEVFAVYDYKAHNSDEIDFMVGVQLVVVRRGDEYEKEWWWCRYGDREGYVPRNLLGLYPRVTPMAPLVNPQQPVSQQATASTAASNPNDQQEDDEDVHMSS